MQNNVFIKNNIEKVIRGEYTDFLDPIERKTIIGLLNKKHISYQEFIPYKDATKTIICQSYPKVSLLKINSKIPLKHNEILGALFSHNIVPNKYGDIIIDDNQYIIILDSIKKYLLLNFKEIGNNHISLEEINLNEISNYEVKYEEKELVVSSLRLDNLVSHLTNKSRNGVDEMFKSKYILVNYLITNKKTYIVKDNDIISIRHYGKYLFKEIIKKTAKGHYIIKICKYK